MFNLFIDVLTVVFAISLASCLLIDAKTYNYKALYWLTPLLLVSILVALFTFNMYTFQPLSYGDFNTLQNLAIAFGVLSVGIFLIEWNIDEKGLDLPVRANIN